MIDEKELIRRALMGDKQAQEECTEKGIVLPCPFCGDDVTITEIPAHKHCIVNLPEYGGGCFIECDNCTYAISGDDVMDALRTHNARPAPPIGRCGECKYCVGVGKNQALRCTLNSLGIELGLSFIISESFCSNFEPREE